MSKLLVCFVVFLCLYFALKFPVMAIFGIRVEMRRSKTLTTIIRWRKRSHSIWSGPLLRKLLELVAGVIPLSPESEAKMNEELARADLPYSAQEYYAKAILSGLAGLAVALFAAMVHSTILVIGGLLLAVYLFMKNYEEVKDLLRNKYELIESEIPTFIRSVESGLKADRDIIRVMERYNRIASPAMRSELEILIADMNTSSVPQALMKFDNRMNTPEISRLVAALVEVDRGVDASLTLQYLAQDMTSMRREMITRELDKRPGKMKMAILPAGAILVVMMFYMLIEAVIKSSGSIF